MRGRAQRPSRLGYFPTVTFLVLLLLPATGSVVALATDAVLDITP
jgi:hypothetical protein